jgi:hypothetical protein
MTALVCALGGPLPAAAQQVGEAFSFSSTSLGIALDGFTDVARRQLPKGIYAVTTTGVIRNSSTTSDAHVSCDLGSDDGNVEVRPNYSSVVAPPALSPGVPGAGTWSIVTTVRVGPGGGRIEVTCGNFGGAPDTDVEVYAPSIVAVRVASDNQKTGS